MTIFYSNDNPIKSNHIATMRYDKKGYVRNELKWFWEDPDADKKNNTSMNPKPGVVVEFPWSNDLSETEISSYNKYQKDRVLNGFGGPTRDGPDMFPSSKEYTVYKMFCDLVGSHGRILITNENKSSLFFETNEDGTASVNSTEIANLIIKLEKFADMVIYGFAWLVSLVEANELEKYKEELLKFKTTIENFYNNEILKYAIFKVNFYEWNLIDFLLPKEPVGTWIPDDNDNVELLKESREKTFGKFHNDKALKKVYFDLYDLCFDGIVDFQWRGAVGEGWKPLVRKAFEKFREREEKAWFWWKRIIIAQIKEKFGTLRIYVDFPSDWYFNNVAEGGMDKEDDLNREVEDYLFKLDEESSTVCEKCGITQAEDPTVKTAGPGWIVTLCDSCRNHIHDIEQGDPTGKWELQENFDS